MKNILITGCAGFIGFHLAKKLIGEGYSVLGIDNVNDYYDLQLKQARLSELGIDNPNHSKESVSVSKKYSNFSFSKVDVNDISSLSRILGNSQIDIVIHLAAQAGVRYSLENPNAYIDANIAGTVSMLELCKKFQINKYLFASSSSVYGKLNDGAYHENMNTDQPASLYAASKKSSELITYVYSDIYKIQSVGLRFFTVYGPWGRPDMAPFIFTKSILEGKGIELFNEGKMSRDFTFIDDIVESISRILKAWADSKVFLDVNGKRNLFEMFNIGNSNPIQLLKFVETIEEILNRKAKLNLREMQPGDVYNTWADTQKLEKLIDFKPQTSLKRGLEEFIVWYKKYYGVEQ